VRARDADNARARVQAVVGRQGDMQLTNEAGEVTRHAAARGRKTAERVR
jgi:hypothetical protein